MRSRKLPPFRRGTEDSCVAASREASRPAAMGRRQALLATGLLLWTRRAPAREKRAEEKQPLAPPSPRARSGVLVDRVVVRFSAPEGAGRERPYFVYERELAFEARLVALADPAFSGRKEPYRRHHVQAALERHIAETLLAALTVSPPLAEEEIAEQIRTASRMLAASVGGADRVARAALAEGISGLEQRRVVRRRALSSLYLHRMVTPMLAPSLLELRRAHRLGEGPASDRPFSEAEPALRHWYVERSLRRAVSNYYQSARARLRIEYL